MKLTQDIIDDVRAHSSIVEVISHYIPLTKKGRNYTALCPFHDDHDPSLSISEDKQIYKCFVCGKGGNVFTFVMDYKHLSFPEAVREVSIIEGRPIDIEINKPIKISPYQKLYDLMNDAASFTAYLLNAKGSKDARNYLIKRNIDEKVSEYFKIGYDPSGRLLCNYLKEKGYTDQEIIDADIGRLTVTDLNDVFAGRILFPIADKQGRTVAFTARDITSDSTAKYINSAETKIYIKGDILYNYANAKPFAREAGRVLVCEGVMDVIAFYRAGINYATATLGTACSKKQLSLLRELSSNLLLAYDGDEAGQSANMRLGEMALKAGFNVTVMKNETGLDPDEIITAYEGKTLRDLVGNAVSFIDYAMWYYRTHLNLENYSDRKEMAIKVGALIDLLNDQYDKINYADELAGYTRLSKFVTKSQKSYNKPRISNREIGLDGLTKAEYTILTLIAMSKSGLEIYRRDLGCLISDPCQKLAVLIAEDMRKNETISFARIYDETSDESIKKLILDLSTIDNLPDHYDEELLIGSIEKIKKELHLRHLAQLEKNIQKYYDVDPKKTSELLKEYSKITKEIGGRYGKREK